MEYRIVEWDYSHGIQPDIEVYPTTFANKNVALELMESRSGQSKLVFLEERELTDWHKTGDQIA
jgi:hypothetical protein